MANAHTELPSYVRVVGASTLECPRCNETFATRIEANNHYSAVHLHGGKPSEPTTAPRKKPGRKKSAR